MEISFPELSTEIEYKALEESCRGVDGAFARRNEHVSVLIADTEDAVWNVWRGAIDLKESAEDAGEPDEIDAAVAVKEAIEEKFNTK